MASVCLYLTRWAIRGEGDKGKCAHEWHGCASISQDGQKGAKEIKENVHMNGKVVVLI
jgi:hypothetical protein